MSKKLHVITASIMFLILFSIIILFIGFITNLWDFRLEWLFLLLFCSAVIWIIYHVFCLGFIKLVREHGKLIIGRVVDYNRSKGERTPIVAFNYDGHDLEMATLNTYYFYYKPYEIGIEIKLLYAREYPDLVIIADTTPEINHVFHTLIVIVSTVFAYFLLRGK